MIKEEKKQTDRRDRKADRPDDAQELLDAVNKAIMSIMVGGQSYKIGSRTLTRADLKTLYDLRNDLTAQVASDESVGLLDDCYVAFFSGR